METPEIYINERDLCNNHRRILHFVLKTFLNKPFKWEDISKYSYKFYGGQTPENTMSYIFTTKFEINGYMDHVEQCYWKLNEKMLTPYGKQLLDEYECIRDSNKKI